MTGKCRRASGGERPSDPTGVYLRPRRVVHIWLCKFYAARCSDTLETGGGLTQCGVTALRAANAVKVFREEKARDKELTDGRFSAGFGCEIRDKASPAEVTDAGFQLLATDITRLKLDFSIAGETQVDHFLRNTSRRTSSPRSARGDAE